jgi:site-specific recombinase XerD
LLAGIPQSLAHPHSFKHSRGNHLLDETGKVHVVQDALGHASIANTMIYAQTSNRARKEAVEINRKRY